MPKPRNFYLFIPPALARSFCILVFVLWIGVVYAFTFAMRISSVFVFQWISRLACLILRFLTHNSQQTPILPLFIQTYDLGVSIRVNRFYVGLLYCISRRRLYFLELQLLIVSGELVRCSNYRDEIYGPVPGVINQASSFAFRNLAVLQVTIHKRG